MEAALRSRAGLLERLHGEGTDCYRVLHGAAEGLPGTTIDRYGPTLLLQTQWQEPIPDGALESVLAAACQVLATPLVLVVRRRDRAGRPDSAWRERSWQVVGGQTVPEAEGREMGVRLAVGLDPTRLDPPFFLDLRAGRRRVMAAAAGKTVLNLFASTCSAGVCAAVAGASDVWNVDWSRSALDAGVRNAARNGVDPGRFRVIREDFYPAVRQLAGLPVNGRGARRRAYVGMEPKAFDVVILDPPPWSVGPFGAIDAARDYEGLLKPALLATAPGGHVLATNHALGVHRDSWMTRLERCADKAGRSLSGLEQIDPEADFPTGEGEPLTKMAWLSLPGGSMA